VKSREKHKSSFIHGITRQWQEARPDLDLHNFMLQIYLQRLGRIIEHAYIELSYRRFGIRATDMRVLFALRRGGPPFAKRPTDLFKALLVTSGAITKQVDRLVEKKLVRRLPDPDYGGGFLVQLTDRGLDTIDRATTVIANEFIIGPAMAKLKPREREAGERFCLSLIAALEELGNGDVPTVPEAKYIKSSSRKKAAVKTGAKRPLRKARA